MWLYFGCVLPAIELVQKNSQTPIFGIYCRNVNYPENLASVIELAKIFRMVRVNRLIKRVNADRWP